MLTVPMNRSASSTVSSSSLTGSPTQRSGPSARPMAAAMRSGGVVTRHRLADCSATKVRLVTATCGAGARGGLCVTGDTSSGRSP